MNNINLEEKKKKPYSSKTYTTGDPKLNIDHFNKMLSGKETNTHTDGYLNGTFKNSEAEKACTKIGTFASQSPDGASSISTGGEAGGSGEGGGCCESFINESGGKKGRKVTRYFIKPQNIWCAKKTDIINALIDNEDQDCTVYTLINLDDNKDVTKLTSNDVIYYYEDGILYDKNRVRLMDYNLYVKNEEERPKLDVNTASDAAISKAYADRLTGLVEDTNSYNKELNDIDINNLNYPELSASSSNNQRKFILYCHTNKLNGKKYFGITTQKDYSRWRQGAGYKNQPVFYSAISKYGWDNFEHEILASDLTEEEAKMLEKKYIKDFHTYVNDNPSLGYNTSIGGEGNLKYSTGEERKAAKKISQHNSYLKNKDRRLTIAKQNYDNNRDFYLTKSHDQYIKHRDERLLKDHEYQATLKQELDLIRNLNKLFPNKLASEDVTRIINFRNCRNKPYLDSLLANFSSEEIGIAIQSIEENFSDFGLEFPIIDQVSGNMDEALMTAEPQDNGKVKLDFGAIKGANGEIKNDTVTVSQKQADKAQKLQGKIDNAEPFSKKQDKAIKKFTKYTNKLHEDNELNLDFDDIDAQGNKLNITKCCICGDEITGYGNNPEPYKSAAKGVCCDACNLHFVIPARINLIRHK